MSTDASTSRRGRKTAVIVVAVMLFVGSVPSLLIIGQLVQWERRIDATRNVLLKDIDHVAVRDAGRMLLSQSPSDSPITDSQLPTLLRQLGVKWGHVDQDGRLQLEFGGGFHHHGLLIVPQSDEDAVRDGEHVGYTSLADGIWYYEDKS